MNAIVHNGLGRSNVARIDPSRHEPPAVKTDIAAEALDTSELKQRLAILTRQLANEVAKLSDGLEAIDAPSEPTADTIRAQLRREIKARRLRERMLPEGLFADPAWDILLDLTLARLDGRQTPVSSLCIAAAVPTTTALRWIKTLLDRGLIERRPDPDDRRRHYIHASDDTFAMMMRLMGKRGEPAAPLG